MQRTHAIVIGGGQAGLAVSRCLTEAGLDHAVLERGQVGEAWRSQRWDSLRLLSPNWMIDLPGMAYDGDDPDGYLDGASYLAVLERYQRSVAAPVHEHTTVEAVSWDGTSYTVRTDQGTWVADDVVVATGHCMRPNVPSSASGLAATVDQLTPDRYRNPGQLADGGVLVVGASATGLQLAEELARSGRDVVLAVGGHTRIPRSYRGFDIFWWLRETGMLDDLLDDHPDPVRAPLAPSLQLIGSPRPRNLDLATCRAAGVQLAGRFIGADGTTVGFASDLEHSVREADRRMHRTLDKVDWLVASRGLTAEVDPPDRPGEIVLDSPPRQLDLAARGITTVVWATGYSRRYPWLPAAALDRAGEIRHRNGIGALPGLAVVGLRFQRHRSSNFIGGVGRDAQFVVDHIRSRTDGRRPACA